jgi:hypothetical protein
LTGPLLKVYDETMKRKLQKRIIYECRGDERPTQRLREDRCLLQEVKPEIKRIYINGCRDNERLNTEKEGSKRLTYTGLRG